MNPTSIKPLTLESAWAERQRLYADGLEFLKKSNALKKDIFPAPANAKASFWYSSISSYYEAERLNAQAAASFYASDTVWYDAVIALKGNIRLDWVSVGSKGYRCSLESGEVFEP